MHIKGLIKSWLKDLKRFIKAEIFIIFFFLPLPLTLSLFVTFARALFLSSSCHFALFFQLFPICYYYLLSLFRDALKYPAYNFMGQQSIKCYLRWDTANKYCKKQNCAKVQTFRSTYGSCSLAIIHFLPNNKDFCAQLLFYFKFLFKREEKA